MSENQLTEEQMAEAIYAYAAEEMSKGASNTQVKASLVEKGLDAETADVVIGNLTKMKNEAKSGAGKKNMLFGALWCIGGIAVTAITHSAASDGGSYVVAWGAIVFGAIQFLRGVAQAVGN